MNKNSSKFDYVGSHGAGADYGNSQKLNISSNYDAKRDRDDIVG